MMTLEQAMAARHSVRSYTDAPLSAETKAALEEKIAQCNREGGLHIQLVTEEPNAFGGFMAHYGKFSGVKNYFALIGPKGPALEEKCGYYGEQLVLFAQQLGLNTCWVAMTYKKVPSAFAVAPGEALCVVIALGYGAVQGTAHKSKPMAEVVRLEGKKPPEWFKRGVEAALLAPTAMNQQKFTFAIHDDTVTAKAGLGFYTKIDLGIAKYHFALGAGKENFRFADAE